MTGFTDAEGCFYVTVTKNKSSKLGWTVQLAYSIELHKRDIAILEDINNFFGVGNIYENGPNAIKFRIQSVKKLQCIIKHFDKFVLISDKRADYELWNKVFNLIQNKEHLTKDGLHKIVAIKALMKRGLPEELKSAFPNITPAERALVLDHKVQDPHWLAGFTSGEGCFFVNIKNSATSKLGVGVQLSYQITQHSRNEKLLRSFIKYFGCGIIFQHSENAVVFKVYKLIEINEKIIPFFNKYRIHGVKAKDFANWCKVATMLKDKKHLTLEGLEQIRNIKAGMNTGRK